MGFLLCDKICDRRRQAHTENGYEKDVKWAMEKETKKVFPTDYFTLQYY